MAGKKIIVIGATGEIGKAVASALGERHEVIGVSRSSHPSVDIEKPETLEAVFDQVGDVDAVVSCTGKAAWKLLGELSDSDLAFSVGNKLLGQVNVIRVALRRLRDGGSVTVTSGILAKKPMERSAAVSLVNAGLEGFVRAAALEAPRGIRVNVVSPPWVSETLAKMKLDPSGGLPAREVATAYVAAVERMQTGETLYPGRAG
jgi:NAD(P)-dependent dehydrogenase (short-subunit alcohol dehydrogenase family)